MKWEAGMMVGEQVRLVRPLGGAKTQAAAVWLADQLDWKKQVAVKLVTQGLPLNDLDALVAFVEAASEATQLECPRVPQVFDHGLTDDGIPYVISELLEGESLDARLAKGRLEPVETGKIVAQVAELLECVHGAGIVHAGIEPGSIFLCDEPVQPFVKVLNLGIAAARAPRRTSDYIAPEQYMLRPASHLSDLWSLGAVAYEMLTGQPPVDAKQRRQHSWEFTPPSEMWLADVPEGIDAWFGRALNKQPENRFDSARAMAEDLIALMPGLEHVFDAEASAVATPADVGAHKVIEVGTPNPPSSAEEPPDSEPEQVTIEVDE